MTISRIQELMAGTTRTVIIVNLVLTAAWLIASTTEWLDPPHAAIASMDSGSMGSQEFLSERMDLNRIGRVTMGQAIFRTYREIEARPVDELGRYELVGVSGRGRSLKAHFQDTKRKDMFSKRVGETIGPYEVVAIERDHVVLERGNERMELRR